MAYVSFEHSPENREDGSAVVFDYCIRCNSPFLLIEPWAGNGGPKLGGLSTSLEHLVRDVFVLEARGG
jgi:hypothetical protein